MNQSAFLKNSTLLAHELVRDFNKPMGDRACIKINLQKAFDSINMDSVYYIMRCMVLLVVVKN